MANKICSRCDENLPATTLFFYKQNGGKYGLSSWCKKCKLDYNKQIRIENINKNRNKVFDDSQSKICTRCNDELPRTPDYFNIEGQQNDGLSYRCKKCSKEYGRAYNKTPIMRKYYKSEKSRSIRKKCHYKRSFGISVDYLSKLLKAQGYGCAICGTDTPGGRWQSFNLDHDHQTREVRGLLCLKCNRLLGLIEDDPRILKKAISYLERNNYVCQNLENDRKNI